MTLRHELLRYIRENMLDETSGIEIDEDTALFGVGVIDSMGLMQLVNFLESYASVRIPDREVTLANFQSVATIDNLVQDLRSRSGG